MDFCEGIDFVFGLSGNDVLSRLIEPYADDVRVRRAEADRAVIRRYTRRATARSRGMWIGASPRGFFEETNVAIASDGCELTPPRMRERSPRDGGD